MNNKGFTLIEVLVTIVVLGIVMSLVFPNVLKLKNENDLRICQEYETMIEEYARVNVNSSDGYIDLLDLDELKQVKDDCDGYVIIDHSVEPATYKAYISCESGCQTEGYRNMDSRSTKVTVKANDVTVTYQDTIPSFTYNITSDVSLTGNAEDPLTSPVTFKVFDTSGNEVEVNNNLASGTYSIVPITTVRKNIRLITKNGTLTVNKIKCLPPSNLNISTSGIVTWNNSSNCSSSQYELTINGVTETVNSGVNKLDAIVANAGTVTVSLKVLAPDVNHENSTEITKDVNVYSVTLIKGTEIASVTGAGKYISGSSVTINATPNSGKIWNNWIDTSTSEVISASQSYTATITKNWNYTAVAYNKLNNTVTISSKTCDYNGSSCVPTVTATNGTPTIKYYTNSTCTTGETTTAPVNAGTYYAKATVNESSTYFAGDSGCKSAVTINKITNTVTITKTTCNYNGSGCSTQATATYGTPSITYYSNSGCTTKTTTSNGVSAGGAPKKAGTYYAKATVAASTNYNAGNSGCKVAVVIIPNNWCHHNTYDGSNVNVCGSGSNDYGCCQAGCPKIKSSRGAIDWRCQGGSCWLNWNDNDPNKECSDPPSGSSTTAPSGGTCTVAEACAGYSNNPCWIGTTCYYGSHGGTTGYDCTSTGGFWQCNRCYGATGAAKCS